MKHAAHTPVPLSQGVPKTEQTVIYYWDDDGDQQKGWWIGKSVANNKQRFVLHPVYPNNLVIDRATRLVWPRDGTGAGCNNGASLLWEPALEFAINSTFCGYTDWRLPNINELVSIINFSRIFPALDADIFINTNPTWYWTSTTYMAITTRAWVVKSIDGLVNPVEKDVAYYVRMVRGAK